MSTPSPPPTSQRRHRSVVSSFLCTGNEGTPSFRVSVFKRSDKVRVYKGLYAACSGSIDPTDASPLAAALRELHEETGLRPPRIELLRRGASYHVVDEDLDTDWTIWPFAWMLKGGGGGALLGAEGESEGMQVRREDDMSGDEGVEGAAKALQDMITLDWEHTEVRFVRPEEVGGMETVTNLDRSLRAVLRGHFMDGS